MIIDLDPSGLAMSLITYGLSLLLSMFLVGIFVLWWDNMMRLLERRTQVSGIYGDVFYWPE